jgi:hypothetical protein
MRQGTASSIFWLWWERTAHGECVGADTTFDTRPGDGHGYPKTWVWRVKLPRPCCRGRCADNPERCASQDRLVRRTPVWPHRWSLDLPVAPSHAGLCHRSTRPVVQFIRYKHLAQRQSCSSAVARNHLVSFSKSGGFTTRGRDFRNLPNRGLVPTP